MFEVKGEAGRHCPRCCDTGDAVFELVHYADVNVVGFDEDHGKIQLAEERLAALRAGLGNRTVRFVSGWFQIRVHPVCFVRLTALAQRSYR